MRFKIKRRLPS